MATEISRWDPDPFGLVNWIRIQKKYLRIHNTLEQPTVLYANVVYIPVLVPFSENYAVDVMDCTVLASFMMFLNRYKRKKTQIESVMTPIFDSITLFFIGVNSDKRAGRLLTSESVAHLC
jgi:hypothetical protein